MMMDQKSHISMHPPISAGVSAGCNPMKYSPFHTAAIRSQPTDNFRRHFQTAPSSNFFTGNPFDDSFFRAEALAAMEACAAKGANQTCKESSLSAPHQMTYTPHAHMAPPPRCSQSYGEVFDSFDGFGASFQSNMAALTHPITHHHHSGGVSDIEADPRELEAFAEKFKQRRIKLGETQCDVGKSLSHLKIPGVGSLSQSTICRFESLTLSHNNMVALRPVLQAWLEEAEAAARNRMDKNALLGGIDKKRKRTSIAAPEKRSLEAYFAVQPRPSGEKIAAIAEKLDLKKNVVRVWFCNQRQKQKRLKFAAFR